MRHYLVNAQFYCRNVLEIILFRLEVRVFRECGWGSALGISMRPAFVQAPDVFLSRVLFRLEFLPVHQTFLGHDRRRGSILRIEHVSVERSEFYGSMKRRSSRAAYEQRNVQPSSGHFTAELLHLEKRRRDKSACPDDGSVVPYRLVQNPLLLHHHTQVNDIEPVAAQYYARDILPDIVYIPLDRGIDDYRPARA